MADPKSCTNPGCVKGMLRTAPPGVGCASKTSTASPAWASTIAPARPFGPDPTMHALEFLATIFGLSGSHVGQEFSHSLGCTSGHSTTLISPSGVVSMVGAYRPRNCRRHQSPVSRLSLMVVNQYCHSTARISRGGCGKGLSANNCSTSLSFDRSRTSVFATIGYSRHEPRDANHRFQSKRG